MKIGSCGLVVAAMLALGACNGQDAETNGATATANDSAAKGGTLADALAKEGDSQFEKALQSAGLQPTLAGPGPYTILAPSNAGFAKLPAGKLEGLMKPENKAELTGLLTTHILPGTMLAADIGKAIDNGKGKAMLATMGGATLTATRDGDRIVLTDGAGTKAAVTGADEQHSNGVIHRIDSVMMPASGGA